MTYLGIVFYDFTTLSHAKNVVNVYGRLFE